MEDQGLERQGTGPTETGAGNGKLELAHRLGTIGWALFFIWIGASILVQLDLGMVLMGVGLITLVMQALRNVYKLKSEWFWVVVGLLFFLGGLWELTEPDIPLIPVILIVAGLFLFLSTLRSQRKI